MILGLIVALVSSGFAHAQDADPNRNETGLETGIDAEIVISGLKRPSDFSVSRDGETIFISVLDGKQIRRLCGDVNDIVVDGIDSDDDDEEATSISVFAVDKNRVIVGVAGFSSPKMSVALFELSSAKQFPLDFSDDRVTPLRSYQRAIRRRESFDVLRLFEQQRGISMVCRIDKEQLAVLDIQMKDGLLEQLVDGKYNFKIADIHDLSKLTIDPLGGYFVSLRKRAGNCAELVFSQPEGPLIQNFAISLDASRVVSIAFTPDDRRLYALVTAEKDVPSNLSVDATPGKGQPRSGIYEILANENGCSADLIYQVDQPQRMKIDAQGKVWVLCGSKQDASESQLLKITGLNPARSIANGKEGDADEN